MVCCNRGVVGDLFGYEGDRFGGCGRIGSQEELSQNRVEGFLFCLRLQSKGVNSAGKKGRDKEHTDSFLEEYCPRRVPMNHLRTFSALSSAVLAS